MTQNTYSTAQGCQPTWAPRRCGTILWRRGAAGLLVGPAGVGCGAGIARGEAIVGAPRGHMPRKHPRQPFLSQSAVRQWRKADQPILMA